MLPVETPPDYRSPRLLGVFAAWRLQAYGYTLAGGYALFAWYLYRLGVWLLSNRGMPVYHDFTCAFVAGWLALHGQIGSIYVAGPFIGAQEAIVGAGHVLFSNWPYPPTYFLILAPLAILPYLAAFFAWGFTTLLGYVAVIYLIVRQRPAIAVALASPFAAWNFITGQSGALTASLIGAALLNLERRPVLAGIFIGLLTFKPQWGILIPVALFAAGQWRTIASAALTAALLAGLSLLAFGLGPWIDFPGEFSAQADLNLFATSARWGLSQSPYGLLRFLNGSTSVAWLGQGLITLGVAAIIWLVWRSRVRYALKAATLSAAALIASPYAFAYDLTAIAVPVAFLATDQIDRGLLRGEQAILLLLFVASLAVFLSAGRAPIGAPILLLVLWLIVRRALVSPEGRRRAVLAKQSRKVRVSRLKSHA
ncbi:MAG TPA: glycosyltransferase family 87 protein [Stellaceae bacterium]|nr:glycosyltransferase family 87 protein [Stellaceae bacterium]